MQKKRFKVAAGIVGGLTCLTGTAHAQAGGSNEPAAEKGGELSEIVVTAQRRSERAQDVPLTVAALSAEQLASSGIADIQDLRLVVPGLAVGNQVGFAITHLRGVGSTAIGPGIENPVAIYVDGVYYASTSSSLFDFVDVDSVEVLKGPQGTLFGRNATGGLIQVTTRDPTQQTRVDADIGYGNYQTGKGDLYVAGGLANTLAANVAVQISGAGEGYGRNFFNGKEVNRNDLSAALRSKWVWTPADATKVTASVDYSRQRNSGTANQIAPGATNLPLLAPLLAAQPAIPSLSPWDIDQDVQPLFDNKSGGGSLRLNQELGFANLMDLVAYRQGTTHISWDLDYTPALYEAGVLHTEENQFSEELQLSSNADDKIRWTGGMYYFQSGSKYDPSHVPWNPDPAFAVIPGFSSLSVYATQRARSISEYGQATATILPKTELTLGARYTDEKHTVYGTTLFYPVTGGPGVEFAPPVAETSKSFEKATYRVALDYHVTDDAMLYVSYNTGFKSGGFNTQSLSDAPYRPEVLDAYEAGAKTELLGHKLRLNLAGFHYIYHDIQVQKIEAANTSIINGAEARINGVDLDLDSFITEQFSISGSAEYLDATFDSFPNAPLSNPVLALTTPVTTGSAAGNQLPYAPHFVGTLAGNYRANLGASEVDFHVTVNHSTNYRVEPDNVIDVPAYTKVNTFIHWAPSKGSYGVTLWGKNLSNAATISYSGTLASGIRQAHYEPPRTYGITFEYHME